MPDVDAVTLFLALLAVVAQVSVVTAVVLLLGRRVSPALDRVGRRVAAAVGPHALVFALAVAIVATSGSLYLSEEANFLPCKLCWYQRIAMYPLVLILAIAAIRRDVGVRRYALPLALVGGALSTYHVVLERYPSLESGTCDATNPCSFIWVERLGYLTIPTMALSAFALIAVLLLSAKEAPR